MFPIVRYSELHTLKRTSSFRPESSSVYRLLAVMDYRDADTWRLIRKRLNPETSLCISQLSRTPSSTSKKKRSTASL